MSQHIKYEPWTLPAEVPAWKVEVSSNVLMGRLTVLRKEEDDRTFRSASGAARYANEIESRFSIFIPWVTWTARIVPATREPDWVDRLRAGFGLRPLWNDAR